MLSTQKKISQSSSAGFLNRCFKEGGSELGGYC